MASLYIKDEETAALAAELALKFKTTKTDVVRSALREKKANLAAAAKKPDLGAWLRERRRTHPLPPETGLKADKAFFDWLSGEEDIEDAPSL
jgi:antitoxin VapB